MNEHKLIVGSRNRHKVEEFKKILANLGKKITIIGANEIDGLPDIEEDGQTFAANAIKKAEEIAKITQTMVVADDSGLMVDYLQGAPGVRSARYGGEQGNDDQNNQKLLAELADVPWENRSAKFYCAIALAHPGHETQVCTGQCPGVIGFELRGNNGFGYDPLFVLLAYGNRTFAELEPELKNRISHRALALAQLEQVLYAKLCPEFAGN